MPIIDAGDLSRGEGDDFNGRIVAVDHIAQRAWAHGDEAPALGCIDVFRPQPSQLD